MPSLPHKTDGAPAFRIDEADDLLVDRAGQHHFDDFDGGLVGDAQAAGKFRLDAELAEHGADLRAAAVDDDGIDARLFEQNHVAREAARDRLVAHGMAAVLHHDDRIVVVQHMRQRLHQDFRLFLRIAFAYFSHCVSSGGLPLFSASLAQAQCAASLKPHVLSKAARRRRAIQPLPDPPGMKQRGFPGKRRGAL